MKTKSTTESQAKKLTWLDRIKAFLGIGAIVADVFVKNPASRSTAQKVKDGADIAISIIENSKKQ